MYLEVGVQMPKESSASATLPSAVLKERFLCTLMQLSIGSLLSAKSQDLFSPNFITSLAISVSCKTRNLNNENSDKQHCQIWTMAYITCFRVWETSESIRAYVMQRPLTVCAQWPKFAKSMCHQYCIVYLTEGTQNYTAESKQINNHRNGCLVLYQLTRGISQAVQGQSTVSSSETSVWIVSINHQLSSALRETPTSCESIFDRGLFAWYPDTEMCGCQWFHCRNCGCV